MANFGEHALGRQIGPQVKVESRAAVRQDLVAQQAGCRVNQTALDTAGSQHKLAFALESLSVRGRDRNRHRLERLAGKAIGKMRAPTALCVKTAVGRQQGCQHHTLRLKPRHPRAVGAQARPAAPAKRQQHGVGLCLHRTLRRVEAQCHARCTIRRIGMPAVPAMAHVKLHGHARGRVAQALQPGAQQGCCFHVRGKDPARSADKSIDAERLGPVTQLRGIEILQQVCNLLAPRAVARDKNIGRLRVREVEPTLAREQKLAPDRGHGVIDVHLDPGATEHLGRHQTGRPCAHHHHFFHALFRLLCERC